MRDDRFCSYIYICQMENTGQYRDLKPVLLHARITRFFFGISKCCRKSKHCTCTRKFISDSEERYLPEFKPQKSDRKCTTYINIKGARSSSKTKIVQHHNQKQSQAFKFYSRKESIYVHVSDINSYHRYDLPGACAAALVCAAA